VPVDDVVDEDGLSTDNQAAIAEAVAESAAMFREMADLMEGVDVDGFDVDDFFERRARIGVLFDESNARVQRLGRVFGLTSAQARLLQYLHLHVGEPILGPALGGVSGIWEWARRTRELDVEHGWEIEVEKRGSDYFYTLNTVERDEAAAARWQLLNRVRRLPCSGQERVLTLLRESYPNAVHRDDLDYVAKIGSRGRRKRNLDEEGWRIGTHDNDPSIESGYYRLESLEKGPPRAREHLKLRQEVLRAANFECAQCGAHPEPGRSVVLHVHHKKYLKRGGNDDLDNLEVLCRPCHAGKHAVDETAVDDELLNPAADPLIAAGA
jgi:5-methylcytosine-specific restriction endonuclease McrA